MSTETPDRATVGETVTVDVPFEPAMVELTACPGLVARPAGGGTLDVDVRTTGSATDGATGWSHGVATSGAAQGVVGGVSTGGTDAGIGSNTAAVSLLSVDGNGTPSAETTGRVASLDDGSFAVEFPSVPADSGSTRPVVFWRAYPTEPTERYHWRDAGRGKFWTAQLVAPGEHFLGASIGAYGSNTDTDDSSLESGLFAFPDPAVSTPSPTQSSEPSSSARPAADEGDGPATDGEETPVSGSGDGLGLGAGLLGLGLGAWYRRRSK